MWDNADMRTARREKKDEFYTRLEDIEAEMAYYVAHDPDVFQDAVVLLPCDEPEESNFVRYFRERFSALGLKRLIATSYNPEGKGKCFIAEAGDDGSLRERSGLLEGNGDFRSEEVTALRDGADFVVTNPPFSLFQAFILWALDGGVRRPTLCL